MARLETENPATSRRNKTLCLVRHGKAVPKDVGLGDFERTLTKQGHNDCRLVSEQLVQLRIQPDLILSSPADRALETALIVSETVGYQAFRIRLIDALYENSDTAAILKTLRSLPDSYHTVVVCGHNPLLEMLVDDLMPHFGKSIPKGAAVGVSLPISRWSDLADNGTLALFLTPAKNRHVVPSASLSAT